jgi:hypothetical protein
MTVSIILQENVADIGQIKRVIVVMDVTMTPRNPPETILETK